MPRRFDRHSFVVLRLHDLRCVFASTLASNLGDGVVGVALAFAVLDLTGSVTDLGVIIAARVISQVLVMAIGGTVADRVSRRTVMVGADLVRFSGQVTIGVLLLTGHATVLELAVSQVLIGAGGSFFIPASSGLLQTVAGEHVQQANALNVMAGSGASMLGPALGGLLVAVIGANWALIFDGGSYLVSALMLVRLSQEAAAAVQRKAERSTFLEDLRGGFSEVSSRPWLWSLIISMMSANFFAAASPVLAPLICKQHYGGATAYASMSVCFGVGMLIGGSALLLQAAVSVAGRAAGRRALHGLRDSPGPARPDRVGRPARDHSRRRHHRLQRDVVDHAAAERSQAGDVPRDRLRVCEHALDHSRRRRPGRSVRARGRVLNCADRLCRGHDHDQGLDLAGAADPQPGVGVSSVRRGTAGRRD